MSLRSLKRPQTLIWICLAIFTTFAYVRLGRQQPPLIPNPQAFTQTTPPLSNQADLREAAEIRAGLKAGWRKPSQTTLQQNVQEVAVERQDAGIYTGRPSTSPLEDISIRCQVSEICDTVPGSTCEHGSDGLGCLRSPVQRREAVKSAIKWTWKGYKRCAWGKDELHPLSCTDDSWVGLALTMVDGLDTLMLAGLDQEVEDAMKWIEASLDPSRPDKSDELVSHFETTIRVVGGLLAAYHLHNGSVPVLGAAIDTGLRLLAAYANPEGLPHNVVFMGSLQAQDAAWTSSLTLAEATTLTLEFGYLSQMVQAAGWAAIAEPVRSACKLIMSIPGQREGLLPIFLDRSYHGNSPLHLRLSEVVSLGARGDSYYEYLLKQYIFSGRKDDLWLTTYMAAMNGVRNWLVGETAPAKEGGLLFVGEQKLEEIGSTLGKLRALGGDRASQLSPKMDHLVCFLPGVLALGHFHGIETGIGHWKSKLPDIVFAERLMHSCYEMYRQTPTGLAPEIAIFEQQEGAPKFGVGGGHFHVKPGDKHSLLRPETVESLFVMYRVTHNETYRDWAWNIFRAFEKHSRCAHGAYTSLETVLDTPPARRDSLESFFLAETLKYLLLIFSPDHVLPLDEYVFNTEAHPIPILGSAAERRLRDTYLPPPKGINLIGNKFSPEVLQRAIYHYRNLVPRAAYSASVNEIMGGDKGHLVGLEELSPEDLKSARAKRREGG